MMKKQLYLLAGVAAILASCSKTETVEQNPSTAIGFSNAWVGNSVDSKVDETNADNLVEFYVYGGYDDMTHVFENTKVYTSDGGTSWTYGTPLRYWVEGKTYKFAAYAPAVAATYGTVAPDFENGALTFSHFVSNPTNQCDLIYAKTEVPSASADQGKVSFTFNHLLSMVKFTFKSGFANDIKVTVSNLKVYGMVSTGTYNNQGWTPGGAKVEEAAPFTEIKVPTAEKTSDASSDDFAVIPQSIEGTDVTVSFTVNVANEKGDPVISNKPLSAQLPATTWQAGNRYNYNVTISGSQVDLNPIEFGTPTVEPIIPDADSDINVK